MSTRYYFILKLILLCTPLLITAQEWNEISDFELQMTGIPEDPEANAIVLYENGDLKITPQFGMKLKVYRKIKILTEAGKEEANINIRYWHEDDIANLEAYSYSPDGEEHELDDDNIFEEESGNYRKMIFAIPGVEVGSVIEYGYELRSEYISNLEPWYFQHNEYTRYSQINIYLPAGFNYSALPINMEKYNPVKSNAKEINYYDPSKNVEKFTWILKDIPAIKKEPYMFAFSDYYAHMLFQLVSFKDSYNYIKIAKSWDNMAERVWNKFGDLIDQDSGLEELALKVTKDCKTPEQKARRLYDYVQSEIETTDENSFLGNSLKEPEEIIEKKQGNDNEKNIFYMNLLTHAGLKPIPVVISTRSHGQITPSWVQLTQFNKVITTLSIGSDCWYLNPGDPFCPFGYLTSEYDSGIGLFVNGEKGNIKKYKGLKSKNGFSAKTEAVINEDGVLTATSRITFTGLKGVGERRQIKKKKAKKYVEHLIEKIQEAAIVDTFEITHQDSLIAPLIVNVTFHIDNYVEDTGDMVYFAPPLINTQKKNPFIRSNRLFPVEYDYSFSNWEIVKIRFPEKWVMSEVPVRVNKKGLNISFKKIYVNSDNVFECHRTFNLKRKHFSTNEYLKLKKCYEEMVKSDLDQIVMTKGS